jgi:hypothetical protein
MPRNYNAITRRKPRGKYKPRNATLETRGIKGNEFRMQLLFWKKYTMDFIMTLDDKELDILIDQFFEAHEKKSIQKNSSWWYPDDPSLILARKSNK